MRPDFLNTESYTFAGGVEGDTCPLSTNERIKRKSSWKAICAQLAIGGPRGIPGPLLRGVSQEPDPYRSCPNNGSDLPTRPSCQYSCFDKNGARRTYVPPTLPHKVVGPEPNPIRTGRLEWKELMVDTRTLTFRSEQCPSHVCARR